MNWNGVRMATTNPSTGDKTYPRISVVVPVYRSKETLRELHRRIISTLESLNQDFELILVEDYGSDNTWSIIEDLARSDPRVKGIQLSRNFGQHNALLCGIRAASGDIIVTLDDDLQNPPEEIPKLLAELSRGFDVVYGTPRKQKHSPLRNFASQLTKLALHKTMGADTASKVSAFRAFRTQLRNAFADHRSHMVNIDVLLTWGTSLFSAVPVHHDVRQTGTSGYTLQKLITHALNMITGFSIVPLKMASILGFFFAVFGLFILSYAVGRYLISGSSVPGFTFLASIVAIFSGIQLLVMGIFGEYLGRIYLRAMETPPYAIRQYVNWTPPIYESSVDVSRHLI